MNFSSFSNNTNEATETAAAPRNLDLSGSAFKEQLHQHTNGVLIDVRTRAEFMAGTIPEARNLDIFSPDFGAKIAQLDKDATYFVFCRSGNRSAQACYLMHQLGYDVRNLAGGIGAYPF